MLRSHAPMAIGRCSGYMGMFIFLSYASAMNDCQDASCSAQFLQVQAEARSPSASRHPWPHARGPNGGRQSGFTPERWTSHSLNWSFHDPQGQYHNMFAGGPVIDQDENLYQSTAKGVFALNSTGHILWHFEPPGRTNNEVTLVGDYVLGSTTAGNAFAVHRRTGKQVWVTKLAEDAGADCGYPAASDGVFIVGAEYSHQMPVDGGNKRIFGLDVKNGTKLWEFTPDAAVWNFAPLFPGPPYAGSTVFMDLAGGTYRLNVKTGQQLWKHLPQTSRQSFSDGGAGLGPDMVYTCSNFGDNAGTEGTTGMVRAINLSLGSEVWYKFTAMPCNTYPSVGHIANVDRLAVVVAPGSFMGQENLHGEILALDAYTGEQLWRHIVKPYSGPFGQAAGDMEGALPRALDGVPPICLPAHWSAPIIDGDGMVIVGRSDGNMYKVYGPAASFKGNLKAENMTVDSGTVAEVVHLGSAFLHGALAASPNLFAISSCDTLYVFKK